MPHTSDITKIIRDPKFLSAFKKFGKGTQIGDIGKVIQSLTTPIGIEPVGPKQPVTPVVGRPVGPGVPLRPVKGAPVGPGIPVNAFRAAIEKRKRQPRSPDSPTQLRAGAQAFRIRSNF